MSAYRPLFVDAEPQIAAERERERCRCRVLCLCSASMEFLIAELRAFDDESMRIAIEELGRNVAP